MADFGGYAGGSSDINGTLYSYLFGPKVAYRTAKYMPFEQALFGGSHASGDSGFGSESGFATALAGGVDWKATEHLRVRLAQVEYLLTEPRDGVNGRRNNVRVSAGVFQF